MRSFTETSTSAEASQWSTRQRCSWSLRRDRWSQGSHRTTFTHPSKPRNPLLARVARMLGLAEEVGRGVDRMYREMIRSGRNVPSIVSAADSVRVTLVGGAPNTQIARYVASLPDREREDTDAMLTLLFLRARRTTAARDLAPVLQKTTEEAQAVLRRLSEDAAGMLEPTRESARRSQPTYRLRSEALRILGPAVPYQRRTTDEIDKKVIEHVQEYGKVTNRTVRNLLDVGIQRAAAIVSDLVRREILVKTSEAQRGPSVEYGPGPRFPNPKRRSARAKEDQTLF
jgi:ATP-dependent DNA helicase RecG